MIKRTVLVVDDQNINRQILGKILSAEYDVVYACNGKEALQELAADPECFSAVLLDIVMPVMDGYQVLEAMEKDPVLSKIPVIVSSQKDGDEDEVRALSLGAQDFVAKPYKADIIRHRLMNTIRLRETAAMINKVERDELTGLYNKQFFMEKVRETLRENPEKQYDILCFGVERFRLVNDTYGPARGDELLCYIAQLMLEAFSQSGLCGRFMSDMFYALLPHHDTYTNEMFAPWFTRLNNFPIDLTIRLHCGLYAIHDISIPITVMCDRAQLASQKNKGKYDTNFCLYDDSLRQQLLDEQFVTSNMQAALEQRQFHVYYQPKYDLATETVAGAEALVRWIHPEKGLLSPGTFIPLFEKNGFITQLDEYVWETTCRDMRAWMDAGLPPVAVSVNVSRADVYNPKLADILLGLIAKYEIPIRFLHLEITETAYTDNPDQIIIVTAKLRALGFIIEMDDFGSGYSSLNMLAEMPVDVLKLDMRFIQSESKKSSDKGILSFVISLAKWLNLAVVAEGVETSVQIAMLRSMDCNYVQGFYYAKPMDEPSFKKLLGNTTVTEMSCVATTIQDYVQENIISHIEWKKNKDRVLLVVDDIDINRAALAGAFENEYTVVEKENGKEAWDYLQLNWQKVDMVLLDLLMPVMDGFQLLKKIRDDKNMAQLPVIITSQSDATAERRALEMHADDFISKPYNIDIIRHRVHNVIAGRQLQKLQNKDDLLPPIEPADTAHMSAEDQVRYRVKMLEPFFDVVRLVDPMQTMVCDICNAGKCKMQSCFSVWGKTARCNNCISMKAMESHSRHVKLEYSSEGLFFVIAQYVPYGEHGAVIEMVSHLDDSYVDNVFDKQLQYLNLNEINQQLELDQLTGVYNRRHLDTHLQRYITSALNRGKDLGLAMIDVDNFKTINDTYGHLVGDQVIRTMAKMLANNIALSRGDFVARFGGDEFIIVCRDISQDIFVKRILAVSELIEHAILDNDQPLHISISVGCVGLSEFPNATPNELINEADVRLYKAKQKRGTVIGAETIEPDL